MKVELYHELYRNCIQKGEESVRMSKGEQYDVLQGRHGILVAHPSHTGAGL